MKLSLLNNKVVVKIDDNLIWDPRTLEYVELYAKNATAWGNAFADAYTKISEYKPLTGKQGEIRKICSIVNPKTQ